jgi:glycerophosphoryl diester phosphodiesterase
MVVGSELQIIGQRGAAGHAPENTAAAIAKAIDQGVSAVLLDVQYARDGEPVVFRDSSLETAAGVRGSVRDQSIRELSGYDIGFKHGSDFRGLRMLTLDEAAVLVPPEIQLHIEIVEGDPVTPRHLKETLAVLNRRGGLQRCIISSQSYKILTNLRAVDRHCRRGLRTSGKTSARPSEAAKLGCEVLYAEGKHADADLAGECKAAGVGLITYDANDPALIKRLAGLEIAGISSGYPDRLFEVTKVAPTRVRTTRARPASGRRSQSRAASSSRTPRKTAQSEATSTTAAPQATAQEEATPTAPAPRRRPRTRSRSRSRSTRPAATASPATSQPEANPAAPVSEPAAQRETAPAAPALGAGISPEVPVTDPAAPKKRRRGRRGGKRVRARRESQTVDSQETVPAENNAAPEQQASESQAVEVVSETVGESGESKPARPRQRRGRRGGRRHRPRTAKTTESENTPETGPKA